MQLSKLLLLRLGCDRTALDGIVDPFTIDAAIASGEITVLDGKLYADVPNEAVGIASGEDYVFRSKRSRKERWRSDFVYKPYKKGDHYRNNFKEGKNGV